MHTALEGGLGRLGGVLGGLERRADLGVDLDVGIGERRGALLVLPDEGARVAVGRREEVGKRSDTGSEGHGGAQQDVAAARENGAGKASDKHVDRARQQVLVLGLEVGNRVCHTTLSGDIAVDGFVDLGLGLLKTRVQPLAGCPHVVLEDLGRLDADLANLFSVDINGTLSILDSLGLGYFVCRSSAAGRRGNLDVLGLVIIERLF